MLARLVVRSPEWLGAVLGHVGMIGQVPKDNGINALKHRIMGSCENIDTQCWQDSLLSFWYWIRQILVSTRLASSSLDTRCKRPGLPIDEPKWHQMTSVAPHFSIRGKYQLSNTVHKYSKCLQWWKPTQHWYIWSCQPLQWTGNRWGSPWAWSRSVDLKELWGWNPFFSILTEQFLKLNWRPRLNNNSDWHLRLSWGSLTHGCWWWGLSPCPDFDPATLPRAGSKSTSQNLRFLWHSLQDLALPGPHVGSRGSTGRPSTAAYHLAWCR